MSITRMFLFLIAIGLTSGCGSLFDLATAVSDAAQEQQEQQQQEENDSGDSSDLDTAMGDFTDECPAVLEANTVCATFEDVGTITVELVNGTTIVGETDEADVDLHDQIQVVFPRQFVATYNCSETSIYTFFISYSIDLRTDLSNIDAWSAFNTFGTDLCEIDVTLASDDRGEPYQGTFRGVLVSSRDASQTRRISGRFHAVYPE